MLFKIETEANVQIMNRIYFNNKETFFRYQSTTQLRCIQRISCALFDYDQLLSGNKVGAQNGSQLFLL